MKVVCRNCANVGEPKRELRGHFLITVLLLILGILPGLIYMVWRRTGRKNTCAKCGSEQVAPANSAGGQAAMAPTADTHVKCPDCRELVLKDARKCKHCGTALVPQ